MAKAILANDNSIPTPDGSERRRKPRRNVIEAGLVTVDLGQEKGALLLDASEDGMGLQTLYGAPPGATVPVAFELPNGTERVECSGLVVWTEQGRVGVLLRDLAAPAKARLREWLNGGALEPVVSAAPSVFPPLTADGGGGLDDLRHQIAGLEIDAALALIAEHARLMTRGTGVAIALSQGRGLVCRASSGQVPILGTGQYLSTGLPEACMNTGEIVRCEDTDTDPRADRVVCRRLGLRSAVILPLQRETEMIGVLEAFSDQPHAFKSADILLLRRVGELIVGLAAAPAPLLEPQVAPGPGGGMRPTALTAKVSAACEPATPAVELANVSVVAAPAPAVTPTVSVPSAITTSQAPAPAASLPTAPELPEPPPAPKPGAATAPKVVPRVSAPPTAGPAKAAPPAEVRRPEAAMPGPAKPAVASPRIPSEPVPPPPKTIKPVPELPSPPLDAASRVRKQRPQSAPAVPPSLLAYEKTPRRSPLIGTLLTLAVCGALGAGGWMAHRRWQWELTSGTPAQVLEAVTPEPTRKVQAPALPPASGPARSPAQVSPPSKTGETPARTVRPVEPKKAATVALAATSAALGSASATGPVSVNLPTTRPQPSPNLGDVAPPPPAEKTAPEVPSDAAATPPTMATVRPPPPQPAVIAPGVSEAMPAAPTAKPSLPVSQGITGGKLIRQVEPRYPPAARAMGLQGAVELRATVTVKGTIETVRVVKGPPLLADAAVQAIRQWRYDPSLLNGQPIEREIEITVNFKSPRP